MKIAKVQTNDKNIKISFDGQFITTLHDLIIDNLDALPLTEEEALEIRELKEGDSSMIGMIEITKQ